MSVSVESARKVLNISASANELDPRPRGLYVVADGTLTIVNMDATTASVPVTSGQILPIQPFKITALGGATVLGLYA